MLFVHLKLISEFGIGKESKEKRKDFLNQNQGYSGLRKTLIKEGVSGLEKKIQSFKSSNRPGHLVDNNRPDSKEPPSGKVQEKPVQEWDKQKQKLAENKLKEIQSNPELYKPYKAQNKTDAIQEINQAFQNKDIAKLRSVVDKALQEKNLSAQEKLAAFGYSDQGETVFYKPTKQNGVYDLVKAKDPQNPLAQFEVQEDGSFKLNSRTVNNESDSQ